MRKNIETIKLIKTFFLSLPIYFVFLIWEGAPYNAVAFSNSSFIFALVLSIVIGIQWLFQQRPFRFFIQTSKKFFMKRSGEKDYDINKKINQYLGYEIIIALIYFCYSILLLMF